MQSLDQIENYLCIVSLSKLFIFVLRKIKCQSWFYCWAMANNSKNIIINISTLWPHDFFNQCQNLVLIFGYCSSFWLNRNFYDNHCHRITRRHLFIHCSLPFSFYTHSVLSPFFFVPSRLSVCCAKWNS